MCAPYVTRVYNVLRARLNRSHEGQRYSAFERTDLCCTIHVCCNHTIRTAPIQPTASRVYVDTVDGFTVADLFRIDEAFCCRMVEIEMR